jgi:hypothetical protein
MWRPLACRWPPFRPYLHDRFFPELLGNLGSVSDHLFERSLEEAEQAKAVSRKPAGRLVSINRASVACDPGFGSRNVPVSPC